MFNYETGEYDIQLKIPTDNYQVNHVFPRHLYEFENFLSQISVKDQNTLIILLGAFQCLGEADFWIKPLEKFSRSIANPVVLFTGKLTCNTNYLKTELGFSYHRISMFDLVSNNYYNRNNENILRDWRKDCYNFRTKKFYWASSKDWYTRRYILAGLIKSKLLDDGLVNYKCIHTDIPGPWIEHHIAPAHAQHIDDECRSIQSQIPLPSLDNTVEFPQTDVNFYLDSLLGIVTDTFFDLGVFLSEKVFNAINYQQLFFYIGYQNTLQYLKNQGYNTFDDIIDTGYDTIAEPGQRLVAARASLIEFLNRPIEKIRSDYEKSIPAIQHNKELLQKQRPDLEFTNILQKILNEH
jgi:hypothetical protein